jgi:CDP-diacylglycerol--serine O-phosphatidyltransferase
MSAWSARRPGVADVLTLGNALCGTAAILVACRVQPLDALSAPERYRLAALLFLCGTLLDVLDGAAARRWGGTPLGAPLDSLADAITFGVAPVVVVVAAAAPGASPAEQLIAAVGGLAYVGAALLRLADFMAHHDGARVFVGLPTTSACVAAVYLGFLTPPPALLAGGLLVLALLMVSPLVYPAGSTVWALPLLGWIVGLIAIVGLVEVTIPAVASILAIVVVVPLGSYLGARASRNAVT